MSGIPGMWACGTCSGTLGETPSPRKIEMKGNLLRTEQGIRNVVEDLGCALMRKTWPFASGLVRLEGEDLPLKIILLNHELPEL